MWVGKLFGAVLKKAIHPITVTVHLSPPRPAAVCKISTFKPSKKLLYFSPACSDVSGSPALKHGYLFSDSCAWTFRLVTPSSNMIFILSSITWRVHARCTIPPRGWKKFQTPSCNKISAESPPGLEIFCHHTIKLLSSHHKQDHSNMLFFFNQNFSGALPAFANFLYRVELIGAPQNWSSFV